MAKFFDGRGKIFGEENPVAVLHELTVGSGSDRVIDAVGVDATCAKHSSSKMKEQFAQEMGDVAPDVSIRRSSLRSGCRCLRRSMHTGTSISMSRGG